MESLDDNGDNSSIELEIILDDQYKTRDISKVNVIVAILKDKKFISPAVKILAKIWPLPKDLIHLKRVRIDKETNKSEIIICKEKEVTIDQIEDQLSDKIEYTDLKIVWVASRSPFNRWQYEKASKLWPTNFFENKELTNRLDGTCFNFKDRQNIENIMRDLVKRAEEHNNRDFGAIVAPSYKILVISANLIDEHPLRHCSMNLIDTISSIQGGDGVWLDQSESNTDKGLSLIVTQEPDPLAYLCTGYDAFLISEPCIMCSMGLLHSRVKRIFYLEERKCFDKERCNSCPNDFALSKMKLHTNADINHRFDVWKVQLKESEKSKRKIEISNTID